MATKNMYIIYKWIFILLLAALCIFMLFSVSKDTIEQKCLEAICQELQADTILQDINWFDYIVKVDGYHDKTKYVTLYAYVDNFETYPIEKIAKTVQHTVRMHGNPFTLTIIWVLKEYQEEEPKKLLDYERNGLYYAYYMISKWEAEWYDPTIDNWFDPAKTKLPNNKPYNTKENIFAGIELMEYREQYRDVLQANYDMDWDLPIMQLTREDLDEYIRIGTYLTEALQG